MKTEHMSTFDHLTELRKRIIFCILIFTLCFIVSFIYVEEIHNWLSRNVDNQLIVLGPSEVLWFYFRISGAAAICLAVPFVTFQVWQFIKPGLSVKERKAALLYIPSAIFLFVTGICFGYFILFPMVLHFVEGLAAGQFATSFTVDKYYRFMFNLVIPLGILFELPALILLFTHIGILTPQKLMKMRKYAYFILIVISVIISPPDFISDILISVPLIILYEFSILLSKIVFRKKLKAKAELQLS